MSLFTPLQIGSLEMKNRLLRSATGEGAAEVDVGCPTEVMVELYDTIAQGGIGLIITGHVAVSIEGRCTETMTAFYSDDFIPMFQKMVEASHAHGTPMVCQLNHGGRQVNPEHKDIRALCPSPVDIEGADCIPEELTAADIERLIDDYGMAAGRCKQAGFDGVQIHSAHGYLVSQFNSPLTNRRTDKWGGSPEKRRRFLAAVYESMRAHVGDDFPILIKQNVSDFHPDGLTLDESVDICKMLDGMGIDAIELSGGIRETIPLAFREKELEEKGEVVFFEDEAKRIKPEIRCPLIVTGGVRTAATAERLVGEGVCEVVGLCRAMLEEPDLPAKWQQASSA